MAKNISQIDSHKYILDVATNIYCLIINVDRTLFLRSSTELALKNSSLFFYELSKESLLC